MFVVVLIKESNVDGQVVLSIFKFVWIVSE